MTGKTVLVLLAVSISVAAQSRRVPQTPILKATDPVTAASDRSVKDMFEEANGYTRVKAAEFEQKKVTYSESLFKQIRREQKQMAAKYAGLAAQRQTLAGEDLYYLGMLHWIAENMDGASANLKKFVSLADAAPEKAQTARSVIVIVAAKQKNYTDSEELLAQYLKNSPVKLSERARMESELAKAYISDKTYEKAAPHADNAFAAIRTVFSDAATRPRLADELLDDGMLRFEVYRDLGEQRKADESLEDLKATAAAIASPALYYYAVDSSIKHLIETGRKPAALAAYSAALDNAAKDLLGKEAQAEVIQKLKKREKHYKMLGEPAPEFQKVDQWFPGQPVSLASLKGKVVFLDFWAAWCAPCLEAFPSIKEWQQDFSGDGLVILGVTRYYGVAEGFPVDNNNEIEYFKRFKKMYGLPYDFVVTKDNTTQRDFGATALPTAVLIDRKGVVRYLESGTSPTRLEELRENIVKLLAEK